MDVPVGRFLHQPTAALERRLDRFGPPQSVGDDVPDVGCLATLIAGSTGKLQSTSVEFGGRVVVTRPCGKLSEQFERVSR